MSSHRCCGIGQLHYTEVTFDVDDAIDDTSESDNEEQDTIALAHGATILLSGTPKYQPFRVKRNG